MIEPSVAFSATDAALAASIAALFERRGRPVIAGLCGAQGSGKSTTARKLVRRLEAAGLRAVTCSLDDFYLTRAQRAELSRDIHPLLATRGVPGTHDIELLDGTLAALMTASATDETFIPVFDKLADDRRPVDDWRGISGRSDIVILEGWCVGARPQPPHRLEEPINALERDEDPAAIWRTYVNDKLAVEYAEIFGQLDLQISLQAPDFDCVFKWRAQQETELSAAVSSRGKPMGPAELRRFILHFERVSRWLMESPAADLIVELNDRRTPICIRL